MLRRVVVLLTLVLALAACTADEAPETSGPRSPSGPAPSPASPTTPSAADPTAAQSNVDQLGVIGDSLTEAMVEYDLLEPALVEAGWQAADIRIDGLSGRPIDGAGEWATSTVIAQWRDAGFDPRVWLIALGTNNNADSVAEWDADIRGVLNLINSGPAGNYTIYWVTTGYSSPDVNSEQEFEDAVRAIAEDYPNVVVADYGAFLDQHRGDPEWNAMWSDSVHHSKAGYETLRTPFYLETLKGEAPA